MLLRLLVLSMSLCGDDLSPWQSNHHPSDVPRQHVQQIVSGRQEYRVVQRGTMDGRNCRSPQGVWTPFEQTWESNRSVRMENIGETVVVNPWLSNGANDFRTIDAIVARAIEPGMTDQERATALWWQEIQHRFHYEGDNKELLSPVKVFNLYGHNTCGNDSICMAGLWKTAGLKVAPARLVGHCVTQVFYDGAWHLFDGDMHSLYLLRDNQTIAGEQDLVRDHDLIKRTHTQGILRPQGRAGDEWESSIYVFEGDVTGDRNSDRSATMNMRLRPGESLVWRWGHTEPVKCFGAAQHKFSDRICNGLWEYRPNLTNSTWRPGADSAEGIEYGDFGLRAKDGTAGSVTWTVCAPYVIVGGKLEADGENAKFDISWDGTNWEPVESDLDACFPPTGTARYAYHLRCRLDGSARLAALRIVNDLQMAPLSLPEMAVSENQFTYSDDSAGDRRMRITHEWIERSASKPPAAPSSPVSPSDGGDAQGTDVVFEWTPASDPDGDKIADYHFELSSRSDMRWPLSMSFAKLISRTSDAGSARFTLKAPGELNPDCTYYWHVRAKDAQGVWGPWSKTWQFTPRSPAPPLGVKIEYDAAQHRGVLHWDANPRGRKAMAYRVFASDEKGFSVSDEPFQVAAGIYDVQRKQSSRPPTSFPANFVAETRDTNLAVLGRGTDLAAANKAYYRVVAIDESGNRSGPSEYAAAPRPIIVSTAPVHANVGVAYRYAIAATRSIGDVRTRVVGGREVMNFWDPEQPRFELVRGPKWLVVDESTGQLSGTPDRVGKSQVVVGVTLYRQRRELDAAALQWGIEKELDSGMQSVGSAEQTFVIDTLP